MKKITKKIIKAVLDKYGYCKKATIKKKAKDTYLLKNAEIDRLPLLTVIRAELGRVRVIQKSMKKFKLIFLGNQTPEPEPATENNKLPSTEDIMTFLGYPAANRIKKVSHSDLIISGFAPCKN
jgi:hypothetical protein